MRTTKTSTKSRGKYIYYFETGEKYTLTPGKDGVTEAFIKKLHALDDNEVYSNLNNLGYEIENENYDPNNPEENTKKKRVWTVSLEQTLVEDFDNEKSSIMYESALRNTADNSGRLETRLIIREIVRTRLTPHQRKVTCLMTYGYKATEIAKILDVSDAAITKTKKRIIEIFSEYKMYL